jgi:hypothetical protein
MSEESIIALLLDRDIEERWNRYKEVVEEGKVLPSLRDFIREVIGRPIGDVTPKEAVLGVIDSFIFTASYTMEEIIEMANSSSEQRMEELKEELSPEEYEVVKRGEAYMKSLPPLDLSATLEDRIEAIKRREALEMATKEDLINLVVGLSEECRIKQRVIATLHERLRTT